LLHHQRNPYQKLQQSQQIDSRSRHDKQSNALDAFDQASHGNLSQEIETRNRRDDHQNVNNAYIFNFEQNPKDSKFLTKSTLNHEEGLPRIGG
jgi:hypothetical protein